MTWKRSAAAGATRSRRVAAALLAATAVWSTSCSTAPPPAAVKGGTSSAPSVSSAAGAPVAVCFGAMPAGWATPVQARSVATAAGVSFGPGGIAGSSVIGQFNSATGSGIGQLDMTTGKLTTISRYGPDVSGMGAMGVDPPWVVWQESDSQTNLSDWTIHAWNLTQSSGRLLATSPPISVAGQQPEPVVSNGVAAWAQPVGSRGRYEIAQVRAVVLSTGRMFTLDAGRVSSPVYAGPYLIWGKIDGAGHYLLRVIDAVGFKPVATPAPLRSPEPLTYLAGSPQYLAWSSGDLNTLTVWPIGTDRLLRFTQSNSGHSFQFMQLAGHFVVWYTGTGTSVLDLRTGDAFDYNGSAAVSGNTIAVEEQVSQPPKGSYASVRISVLPVAAMPSIRGCTKKAAAAPTNQT
jgi:hypothetical protein